MRPQSGRLPLRRALADGGTVAAITGPARRGLPV
jgi:hypothetical protein